MPAHVYTFADYGITLHRIYVHHPDELGTLARWETAIRALFWQLPFKDYWQGTVIKGFNLSAPETPQQLVDYDRETPGFQTAAGLDVPGKELWISFFPEGWKPGSAPSGNIPIATIDQRISTLSHELGHQYAEYSGFKVDKTPFQRCLTQLFRVCRPDQASNEDECWAEVYRALMGADNVRGYFSDGKPFYSQSCRAILRTAWYLNYTLGNRTIWNLTTYGDWVQWCEYGLFWVTQYYRINANWQKEKYVGKDSNGADIWEKI